MCRFILRFNGGAFHPLWVERGISMAEYKIFDVVPLTIEGEHKPADVKNIADYLRAGLGDDVKNIVSVTAVSGEANFDVRYELRQPKFERIRRITGYLVGTTDRWNNAKRAEEKERVKHF